jgi:transcriptional regulator with XRE-family HTH domain
MSIPSDSLEKPADEPVESGQIRDVSLVSLGRRIRHLRQERRMTLQDLAEATGLSSSMISLVERGRTSPSIGSLVVIASGVRVPIADLFVEIDQGREDYVVRLEDQSVVSPWPGVARRTARIDRLRRVEISVNEWEPNGDTEPQPAHHAGYEYGLLIEGELTVEVEGVIHVLKPGDLISYPSTVLHSLRNAGSGVARAVWVNLESF